MVLKLGDTAMEHMTLHCPKCGEALVVAAQTAGLATNCRQCGERMVVPQTAPAGTGSSLLPPQAPATAPATSGQPASGLATASLVLCWCSVMAYVLAVLLAVSDLGICSVVAHFLAPLFAIPAIICGHVARKRALREPVQNREAKRARIGLSLGSAALVVFGVLAAGLLVRLFLGPHGDPSGRNICMENVKKIGLACKMYASDYSENYPPDLMALWKGHYLDGGEVYTCPTTHTTAAQAAEALATHCDYLYFAGGKNETQLGTNQVVACDKPANHRRFINVVYGDGHCAKVSEDFQQFLRDNHLILPAESAAKQK